MLYIGGIIIEKKEALKRIFECAELYKKNLAGYNLLFICSNKAMEISSLETRFEGAHFLHMTGVKFLNIPPMSAKAFFQRCLDQRLSVDDFDMDLYGHTELKLKVLPRLCAPNLSANMIGEYIGGRPYLITDKLIGNISACIGFVAGDNPRFYVPNSVLAEDARKLIYNQERVLAVFRKHKSAERYEEFVYTAKNVKWDLIRFPEEFSYLKQQITDNGCF